MIDSKIKWNEILKNEWDNLWMLLLINKYILIS
jgi:hypothetical protein